MVKVEVVYAPYGEKPVTVLLAVEPGTPVIDVMHLSGLMKRYPEISGLPVGIFSKKVSLDTPVQAGDRIELYRPLLIDPKQKRRERASKVAGDQ